MFSIQEQCSWTLLPVFTLNFSFLVFLSVAYQLHGILIIKSAHLKDAVYFVIYQFISITRDDSIIIFL